MMSMIKGLGVSGLFFAFFIVAGGGMFFLYTHNAHKLKLAQVELVKIQEENRRLKTQTGELYSQLDIRAKKSRELSNELLQLSEEKSRCYKTVIKYHEKLKKIATAAPNRVELLVNNYFSRMFYDVAKTTGAQ